MDVYKLKQNYYAHNPHGHFFDRDTLKFFGECLSRMRVWKDTVTVTDYNGEKHTCYVLAKYSRNYPGGSRTTYAYFDTTTFDDIITA